MEFVRNTHTIDASGQILGRLATRIAVLLRGKHRADFAPHKDMGDIVIIKNAGKIKVTGRKMSQKIYYRHSGHPGGLKAISMGSFFAKKPHEVLKEAVSGMLPKNKLRARMIQRLKFE